MVKEGTWWEEAYKSGRPEATPWEKGEADKYLKRLIKEGKISGRKVLDACSGFGTQAIYLAKHGFSVSGVDISETAVSKAKERANKAGVKVDFLKGDVQNLPFKDGAFDFIFDRGCLHHQYNHELRAYLKEINRILKAGGNLFIIAFTSRFTTEELTSLFKEKFTVLEHSVFSERAADNHIREFHALLLQKK